MADEVPIFKNLPPMQHFNQYQTKRILGFGLFFISKRFRGGVQWQDSHTF
jgi:hypothetical protein